MSWEVEFTDEFFAWFDRCDEAAQDTIAVSIRLLMEKGITLGHPHSSDVVGSRHGHIRELRIQHQGRPLRVLDAFNPLRVAILLIGGDKTGNDRWYEEYVPRADRIYDEHLQELKREGLL